MDRTAAHRIKRLPTNWSTGRAAIHGLKRVSRPGRRPLCGAHPVPRVASAGSGESAIPLPTPGRGRGLVRRAGRDRSKRGGGGAEIAGHTCVVKFSCGGEIGKRKANRAGLREREGEKECRQRDGGRVEGRRRAGKIRLASCARTGICVSAKGGQNNTSQPGVRGRRKEEKRGEVKALTRAIFATRAQQHGLAGG